MRFERLIHDIGAMPYFDLATIAQISGEPRQSLRMQLSRLVKQGKLKSLRRGMYALAEQYRKTAPNPAVLANRIYTPSYLSFHWALGYYGLIPEAVFTFTSATPRVPRFFKNEFGNFQYKHIKPDCFAGYQSVEIDNQKALIAAPEKALLDLWHIEKGEWTTERMAGMRFQGFDLVLSEQLVKYAEMYKSPRLMRAIGNWQSYVGMQMDGAREL